MLVDAIFDVGSQDYRLTEIHHLDGHIIRIDILRDAYPRQSWAQAQVLSEAKTWTTLASAPLSTWHDQTPSPYARTSDGGYSSCKPLADQLLAHVRQILAIS